MNKIILVSFICTSWITTNAQQPTPTPTTIRIAEPPPDLVGKPVPSWKLTHRSWINTRRPIRWSRLKGRVVVIEFFRIQCPHCQAAAPSRRALYRKYRPHGMRFIGFQSPGLDPTESNWKKVQGIVRAWKLPYPIAFDANGALFKKFGLSLYPTVLVVDRKGIVRFQQTGYNADKAKDLERFITRIL